MNSFKTTIPLIFAVLCCFGFSSLWAQPCTNTKNYATEKIGTLPKISAGQTFGQSFTVSNDCPVGRAIRKFRFQGNGNAAPEFVVKIFKGTPMRLGHVIYTSKQIRGLVPPDHVAVIELDLAHNTQSGNLALANGEYYIELEVRKGSVIPHTTYTHLVPSGDAFHRRSLQNNRDLMFEIVAKSGECTNRINGNRAPNGPGNRASGLIAQSIVANPVCLPGTTFTAFKLWTNGNAGTSWELTVYEGEINPAALPAKSFYPKKTYNLPSTGFGGWLTFNLPGNKSFDAGKTYTFLLNQKGGRAVIHASTDAVMGRSYFDGKWNDKVDLVFEVK